MDVAMIILLMAAVYDAEMHGLSTMVMIAKMDKEAHGAEIIQRKPIYKRFLAIFIELAKKVALNEWKKLSIWVSLDLMALVWLTKKTISVEAQFTTQQRQEVLTW